MLYTFKVLKPVKLGDQSFAVDTILEVNLKVLQYDDFVKDMAPYLERYIGTAPAVSYAGRTFSHVSDRTDNTFKEVLAKIGESHTASPLAEKYRKNKTIKEIKTKEIVKKHRDKTAKAAREAASRRKPKFAAP